MMLGGRETWLGQRPLTERWTLLAPDRPGHGRSPRRGQDFEPEARQVAEEVPEVLPEPLWRVGPLWWGALPPGDAVIPLGGLARADFPTLVVTGGHRAVHEVIGDAIAEGTGAERAVVAGRGHLVPDTGVAFNQLLESFLKSG